VPRLGLLAAASAFLFAAPAIAAPILLEDGVSFVTVDPASQDGIGAWTVNGVQHVRQQWFWIQGVNPAVGNPEFSLDEIHSVSSASDASGDGHDDTLEVVFDGYASILFQPTLRIGLSATPIGGANEYVAEITTELTLNAPYASLTYRIFSYTDVDLFGSFADDDALFTGASAFVTDASGLGVWESSWDRAPDAVDVAIYDATLASLNDAAPTVLGGSTSASGDVTIAAMWEISLPVGGSFTLRQTQTIRVVPEPGVAVMLAIGLAGLAARRRTGGVR